MKTRLLISVVIIVAVIGTLGYLFGVQVMSSLGRTDPAERLTQGEALTTMTVSRGDIARYITASGNLQPNRRVDLPFNVAGTVEEIFVEIGDRVEQGEPLARLNNREQELAYLRARTNYEIALIESPPNTIKEREFDMESALNAYEATILKAPFSGLVTDVFVVAGETVSASETIIQLIDDSSYKVDVSIDELDIGQVQVGQNAMISLDADRTRPRLGRVDHIGIVATVSQSIVTIPVTVRLAEVDDALRPGYTATVRIAVAEATDVVRVPVEAINTETGLNLVTKIEDGIPISIPVMTGVTDGAWIEIVSGLEAGDEIVGLNYMGGGALQGRLQGGRPGAGQAPNIMFSPGGASFGGAGGFRR